MVVAGFPVIPDLLNATDRAQPRGQDLGSKDCPLRIVRRREHKLSKTELFAVAQCYIELITQGFYS